jgi:hypothetical protein
MRPETCILMGKVLCGVRPRRISTVDKLLDELTSKVGLDRGTADKVVQFLRDNAHRLPELLGSDAAKGVMDKLPGGLGGMLAGKG